jgi:hypothetical protein
MALTKEVEREEIKNLTMLNKERKRERERERKE